MEVVPHLTAVLSRMITQLGAIKHENMQWVFSYGEWKSVLTSAGPMLQYNVQYICRFVKLQFKRPFRMHRMHIYTCRLKNALASFTGNNFVSVDLSLQYKIFFAQSKAHNSTYRHVVVTRTSDS